MSLTFDYVTMPPKSQEISQIQTNEIARMQQENQELAAQYQNQIKENSEKTIRRNKAENEELKNDEKKKKQQQQNRKRKNIEKKEEKSVNKEITDHHFDLFI